MKSGSIIRGIFLATVFALVLAACGSGSDEPTTDDSVDSDGTSAEEESADDSSVDGETSDDTPSDTPASEGTVAEDSERDGGTLTMAWNAVPTSADCAVFTGLTVQKVCFNVMGTVVGYDGDQATGDTVLTLENLENELAESIERSDDGMTYTITLRQGVMSPYGNELTTADVEWSIQRQAALDFIVNGVHWLVGDVNVDNPITIIDDYTYEWNLNTPNAVGLGILHWHGTGFYDSTEAKEHATDEDPWAEEWMASNTASFGPYNITSIDPGVEVRLEANPNYWRGMPNWDEVVIRAVPEASNRIQLLLSDQVDFVLEVPFDQVATLEEADNVTVYTEPDANRFSLILNNRDEKFADPQVRRAISLAIDREAISNSVFQGITEPARSGLSSTIPHPEPAEPVTHDPDRAQELLAEAGAEGLEFTTTINPGRPGPFAEEMARLIQSDLAAVGVTMNIDLVPSLADFEAEVGERSIAAWLYTERPAVTDPGYSLNLYNASDSFINNQGYVSEEFDALVEEILVTEPGGDRDELVAQANNLVIEDTPIVYLVEGVDVTASSASLCCYIGYPSGAPLFEDLSRQ